MFLSICWRTFSLSQKHVHRTNVVGLGVCFQLILTGNELGQKIGRLGLLRLLPVPHDVSFLLPNLHSLLQFHLTLDHQHVTDTNISYVLILDELFTYFGTTLFDALGDIVIHH